MMSPKRCPHCMKKIPLRKRFKPRCPHCFKPTRRRSGIEERSTIGQWLEDRNKSFWFFILLVLFMLSAITMQVFGQPDLLNFIDARPVWFVISLAYASMFMSMISRIYFPLLLGAPRILRRERDVIRHYRNLTTWGLILGVPFAMAFTGFHDVWLKFPGTVFLFFIPMALFWSFQGLTLTENDYEDDRVWTFLQELGAQDRLEHRHHALFVMIGIPASALMFYFFLTHPVLARMIQESSESGILAMLSEAYHRVRGGR